jgi:3-deoxy-D-manno-octulosonate 8-phosphate phosphatase (KDO 8-P phosphatase)
MALTAQDRARKIKIILFDVDGVWTDGTIWLVPAAARSSLLDEISGKETIGFGVNSTTMTEAKGYSAHDGTAISLARIGGMKCGVITKRISETVATRARDLKLEYVYQGCAFKMQAIREIVTKEGVTLDEICYVGDDVIDLPAMREVARDAVEFILEAKGTLDHCIEAYIDEDNPIPPSMDIGRGGADLK